MSTNLSIQEFEKADLEDWMDDETQRSIGFIGDEIEIPIFAKFDVSFSNADDVITLMRNAFAANHGVAVDDVFVPQVDDEGHGFEFTKDELLEIIEQLHTLDDQNRAQSIVSELQDFIANVDWEESRVFAVAY